MSDRRPASASAPHRARQLLALLACFAAVAVGGCAATNGVTTGQPGPPSPISATPTPTVGPGSASGSAQAPRTIPASAFFQMPTGLRRDDHRPVQGSQTLPRLCNQELAPGTGVVVSTAVMHVYKGPNDPPSTTRGVLYQTIRSYDGDGATQFMNRIRSDLAACASYQDGNVTVRVRTAPLSGVGDEALIIDRVQPQRNLPGDLEPAGGEQTNRAVVIRFGTVVTILNDTEYERSSSTPATVDIFIREATQAIRTWLRY